jgi:hypothetical protein
MVTIETAERLAAQAGRAIKQSPAVEATAVGRTVCALLDALVNETTIRTATEVKIQDDSDRIIQASVEQVRKIRNSIAMRPLAKPEFSWIPGGFMLHALADASNQQAIDTPAGYAVITAIADGTFEIETSFHADKTRIYNDTLSADAAMGRLFGLVAAHTATFAIGRNS